MINGNQNHQTIEGNIQNHTENRVKSKITYLPQIEFLIFKNDVLYCLHPHLLAHSSFLPLLKHCFVSLCITTTNCQSVKYNETSGMRLFHEAHVYACTFSCMCRRQTKLSIRETLLYSATRTAKNLSSQWKDPQ